MKIIVDFLEPNIYSENILGSNLGGSMEKRNAKIQFPKVGNGTGARIVLSLPLLKKLGITQDERDVEIIYDEDKKTVTIQKRK